MALNLLKYGRMKLELYHLQQCPFSAKVRNYIEENNLKQFIEYKDADDQSVATELEELTGKFQVPCLVIDGKPMLESDEIIAWLGKDLSSVRQAS